jgi:hypothetical protein
MVGSQEPAAVPRSGKGAPVALAYPFSLGRAYVVNSLDSDARLAPAALMALTCFDEMK